MKKIILMLCIVIVANFGLYSEENILKIDIDDCEFALIKKLTIVNDLRILDTRKLTSKQINEFSKKISEAKFIGPCKLCKFFPFYQIKLYSKNNFLRTFRGDGLTMK